MNKLYLDEDLLEDDLRKVLRVAIKSDEAKAEFGTIHLIGKDSDFNQDTHFPAISLSLTKNAPLANFQTDIDIEPYTRFSVTVETYTSGKNRRSTNIRLAQFVTFVLQLRLQLDNYYTRGLQLDQEQELSSFVDNVNRRVLRFSGAVDNASKLIFYKGV